MSRAVVLLGLVALVRAAIAAGPCDVKMAEVESGKFPDVLVASREMLKCLNDYIKASASLSCRVVEGPPVTLQGWQNASIAPCSGDEIATGGGCTTVGNIAGIGRPKFADSDPARVPIGYECIQANQNFDVGNDGSVSARAVCCTVGVVQVQSQGK